MRRNSKPVWSSARIEQEAVAIAMDYLRARGRRPKNVSVAKAGHDIRVGRKRIEVKGSRNDRAQNVTDIRRCCTVRLNRVQTKATVTRRGLSIDALIEVTRIGQPGGPVVHYYPKSVLQEHGSFWVWTDWRVLVPAKERERYRGRLSGGGRGYT